jgi:putative ABC transport system permease protein
MRRLRALILRIMGMFNMGRADRELAEELEGHLQMHIDDNVRSGMTPEQARRNALIKLGGIESVKENYRDRRGVPMLARLLQELRYGLRRLATSPVLTATIVLTVGMGIGATTAIFSVINAALIQPLPYPDSDQIVRIYTDASSNRYPFSVVDYLALEEQQTSFQSVAAYQNVTMTFNRGNVAERIRGKSVTWRYFSLLGITPRRGRILDESDGVMGTEGRVVLSHGFWIRYLAGDEAAVGQAIQLDGRDFTVVGILGQEVGPLEQNREFFVARQFATPTRKGPFGLAVLARLTTGTDVTAAAEELRIINRRLFPIWQASYQDQNATWAMMDLKELVVGDVGTTLAIVLGAVGFVLLIASTNAANLLLARTLQRSRELAVREALGASRGRLLQHLLTETYLLMLASAVVGLLVTVGGITLLRTVGANYIPRTQEISLNVSVLWFLVAITVGSGLLFGLIPSLQCAKSGFDRALYASGRSATDTAGLRQFQRALVVTQFAIAVPLLIGAGLLIGSLVRLKRIEPGINSQNIISFSAFLPPEKYPETGNVHAFWNEALMRVRVLPGVQAATLGNARPPLDMPGTNNFNLEDKPTPPNQSQPDVPWISVMPDYFSLLGIPLIQGRVFDDRDHDRAPPVAVVDQAWAKRFFPDENILGRRFRSGGSTTDPRTTVVGMVGDVKYRGLDVMGEGTIYRPMLAGTFRQRYFLVKTSTDPLTVLPSIRNTMRELDSELPLSEVGTIDDFIWNSLNTPQYLTILVGGFAVVALILSIIGINGVMTHFVQQHTKEIGIRIALGCRPPNVLRMVVFKGMRLAGVGVILGIGSALFLTRFMSSLLFEVRTTDATTFSTVSALMLGAAIAACFVPAQRAATVDPIKTLRED